ncbi:MAG: substrate-binding domain-containing protein [Saprospiraceae bacterium]|nr:substrate-binding domain-containing protein [Saprospiraceae bacterium]
MIRLIPTLFLCTLFAACGEKTDKSGKVVDTPTTGTLTIMADEGYQPIIASSIEVFNATYRRAKLSAVYTSEGEAVNNILKDSTQVIIITRTLTEQELKFFKQRGFEPKVTPIAYDAVAFVVHPTNNDSVFTIGQMRDILQGKTTKWSEFNPKSKLGDMVLVFDNPLSGTVRYARDSIAAGAPLPANASALNTNEEVINYVAKTPGAIGIIGANWISDTDDKGVQKFLRDIRLVDIAKEAGAEGFGPYQAYLSTGDYPFKRTVYIINAQARTGLGQGFASYLAGPDGQRIVLKDGLLPAQAPTRLIQVSKE